MNRLLILTTNASSCICHSYSLHDNMHHLNEFESAACILMTRQSSSQSPFTAFKSSQSRRRMQADAKACIDNTGKLKFVGILAPTDGRVAVRTLKTGNT